MLYFEPAGIQLVIVIAALQFVVEMLVVRNYGLAAIFITPLTIFLAENSSGMRIDVNALMEARLFDTVIGSLIGVAAGWVLHNNLLVSNLEKQIRSLKLLILRK